MRYRHILTHSKPTFRIIFVLTITFMISTAIIYNGFSNSIFAFSNKYSKQERYNSGVRDGNKDCQNGSDTAAYQSSPQYLGHSKYYQQGYDDTVNKCSSTPDTTTPTQDNSQQQSPNGDMSSQSSQNDNNAPSGSNGQILDIGQICNTLQIAFYHSCNELVNPDGSLH